MRPLIVVLALLLFSATAHAALMIAVGELTTPDPRPTAYLGLAVTAANGPARKSVYQRRGTFLPAVPKQPGERDTVWVSLSEVWTDNGGTAFALIAPLAGGDTLASNWSIVAAGVPDEAFADITVGHGRTYSYLRPEPSRMRPDVRVVVSVRDTSDSELFVPAIWFCCDGLGPLLRWADFTARWKACRGCCMADGSWRREE